MFLEGTALFLSVLQQRVGCFLGPFEFLAIWMREAFRAFFWDANFRIRFNELVHYTYTYCCRLILVGKIGGGI